jgi:hypothetical protein
MPYFDSLRKVKARNVSNEFCQKKYRRTSTNEDTTVWNKMIYI